MKKFILSLVILLASAKCVNAQDKYDFLSISYDTDKEGLYISLNGKEFSKEQVPLSKKDKSYLNANPLLSKVLEYQDKGWEVMNINSYPVVIPVSMGSTIVYSHVAYLKKKRQ